MRHFTIFICLFVFKSSYSQTYIDTNLRYNLYQYSNGSCLGTLKENKFTLDTMMNGHTYYNMNGRVFREDSINHIVYRLDKKTGNEILFLDFNKKNRDTLDESIISQVDSIILGNKYYKRIDLWPKLGRGYGGRFVEGIGHISGTMFMDPNSGYIYYSFCLYSVSFNKALKYQDTNCKCIVSTPGKIVESSSKFFVSNDLEGKFIIHSENANHLKYSIRDIMGREVKSSSIESNATELNLENYPKSIYLLEIWDKNGNRIWNEKLLNR